MSSPCSLPAPARRRGPAIIRTVATVMVASLALAGCSSGGGRTPSSENDNGAPGQIAATERIKIAMVTHAAPGNTFWDTIRKGAEEASAKDNVDFLYASDPEGGRQSQLIQQYVDQNVDGIAVTLAKPEALKDVLAKAAEAGIPVVTLNSGGDQFKDFGAFAHFGSDEGLAGEAAGERLKSEGKQSPICVIHEQGNVGLETRCEGVKNVLPNTEILYVQGSDMTQVASTATAKLQTAASADAVVALDAPIAMTLLDSRKDAGRDIDIVSFDMNGELAQAISDGQIAFTIDQQPWLQGYMAIDALWQHHRGGFQIGGGLPTLTGPAVVNNSTAGTVLEFAKEGIR